ncbi:MAG: polyprenyl synthetase family protein [Bacteroidota bacterium]
MHSLEFLLQKISQSLQDLPLDRQPEDLYQPIKYSLSMGGKRLRPLLTLMACDLVGGDLEDAMPAAIGIEIFHNFTLLHDDIMDNAPLRRGKDTVYKKWNTNIAILSGDTMFALAYEKVAETRIDYLPAILDVFTTTAREVCEGQQYDMNFETEEVTSLEDYLNMIRLKTAVLLGCCLKAGALAGGADKETANILYRIGENLGIAFQIRDDFLDTFGDELLFGKKTGGDILANKKTYLYLAALQNGSPETREALQTIYQGQRIDASEKIECVKNLFIQANVEAICEETTTEFYNKALDEIRSLKYSESRLLHLKEYARNLIGRTY